MNLLWKIAAAFTIFCLPVQTLLAQPAKRAELHLPVHPHSRLVFGSQQVVKALQQCGYRVKVTKDLRDSLDVVVVKTPGKLRRELAGAAQRDSLRKEGFHLWTSDAHTIAIRGKDYSGVLYGCLALADTLQARRAFPARLQSVQSPEMVMRGACIGMSKPYYLPGRTVYEYPYTPETFPWFYDKALWIKYLDMLVENRMNSVYLWSGHPFASLVRVPGYEYAVEVDSATFRKNEEIFSFLTTEADKRGIWVIQMFYNIIVSKPFAERHHIKTQDRNRPIVPLIADYTHKSIAAFVQKYPNVGLMVCLGEAMEGVGQDDVDWFCQTIIPGVKDGLAALGKKEQPPLVLRAHDTDAPLVMASAKKVYSNLYTEAKFNGEALTTYEPRGSWAELHRTLSRIGTVQIENVHILANLEPFRYGATDFIQKSVQAMHGIYEANGLHLYPQASYWDWPYTADSGRKRTLQIDRDWIWYKAWSRYAWNSKYSRPEETAYWQGLLAAKYGCSLVDAGHILEAYEQSGEISPKILRRYGITDGNRQTMTLGMFMPQLVNPRRFGLFTLMYESESPEGEMIIDYALKEATHQPHVGETPVQVAEEIRQHGDRAVAAIQAVKQVMKDTAEYARLYNDMLCYRAMAYYYSNKALAAVTALRYKYSGNVQDLQAALPYLEKSVSYYRELTDLTKSKYRYANSMQTQQRKIPINGRDASNKNWYELLPQYEQELASFRRNIDSLKSNPVVRNNTPRPALQNAAVQLEDGQDLKTYTLDSAISVYSDTTAVIRYYAPELKGLKGLLLNKAAQVQAGTSIRFRNSKPVKVLVGYFINKEQNKTFAPLPNLETDASANEYGQSETKIANALIIDGMPVVNIHSYSFPAGSNTLTLPKGAALVAGFIADAADIPKYDAGLTKYGKDINIDWLFEK